MPSKHAERIDELLLNRTQNFMPILRPAYRQSNSPVLLNYSGVFRSEAGRFMEGLLLNSCVRWAIDVAQKIVLKADSDIYTFVQIQKVCFLRVELPNNK